jgi:GT2 family glycosyltransferase
VTVSILALVVVYGTVPSHSPAITSLGALSKKSITLRTLVWDNSPQKLNDSLPDGDWGEINWVHTPENRGLSGIYNVVIADWLKADEHLLLLDQDTLLPENFFDAAAEAITSNPTVNLFLPMVRAHERWVSPLYAAVGWGRYWKQPRIGPQPSRHLGAINSGMIISAHYLHGVFPGYARDLDFYGTDTFFMLAYRRQNKWAFVLDAVIHHDLSFYSTSTQEKIKKFRVMRNANVVCYSKTAWPVRFAVRCLMTCAAVVYSFRYRSIGFLRSR